MGLEHPALDVPERRKIGAGEFVQSAFEFEETALQGGSGPAQGRAALVGLRRHGALGIAEEGLLGDCVRRGAIGRQEGKRLTGAKPVATDHLGQAHLLPLPEDAQGQRHRKGKRFLIQAPGELRGELSGKEEPAVGPGLLLPQEPPGRLGREAVLLDERPDDAGLVHGPEGAHGGVGLQHPGLRGDPLDGLDDNGDLGAALAFPDDEALEAVEDFEHTVLGGRDADRERRQRFRAIGALPAKRPERGPQAVDRDVKDEGRHGASSRGRSW